MHKIILIFFIFFGFNSFAQLGIIDDNTTSTPPYTGQQKLSSDGNKVYFRGKTGASKEIVSINNTYLNPTWISQINAANIGTGIVSTTEFNYLDGVTSSIQSQLDTKYDASNPDNYTTFYTTNNGGLPIDNELMGKSGDIVLDVANGSFWSYAPVGMTNWWNVFSAYPYSNPLNFITSSTASSTYLSKSNNLSDLVSASTARTNLGLTTLATTTPATGVATFLATPSSANLLAALTTKTGTGSVVFNTNPSFSGDVAKNDGNGYMIYANRVADGGNYGFYYDSGFGDMRIYTNSNSRISVNSNGNVAIGGLTANTNAILDIQGTKALKLPVMTATQASAITPSAGFMVYVTDTNGTFTSVGFWGYTTSWQKLNN